MHADQLHQQLSRIAAPEANLSKAAATFQAPLTKTVRTVEALRAQREQAGSAEA